MLNDGKDKEGNPKTSVSIHGWNSDVEFSYGSKANGGMLMVEMMAYVDAKQSQCVSTQIGVTLTDGEIDEVIELLKQMKNR